MNKKLFLIAILIVCSSAAMAQYKSFLLGGNAHVGFARLQSTTDELQLQKSGLNTQWGVNAEYFLVENYSLSLGLTINTFQSEYAFQNQRIIGEDSIPSSTQIQRQLKVRYLDFPLMLKLKTDKRGKWRACADVGYSLGFRVNAQIHDTEMFDGTLIEETSGTIKQNADYAATRSAILLHAGLQYSIYNSTAVTVGFSFNRGISNVIRHGGDAYLNAFGLYAELVF